MSKNNLILVIHFAGRHYVVQNVNADTEWNFEYAKAHIHRQDARWSRTRADALVLAHNIQNATDTEYGVREIFLDSRQNKRRRTGSDCEDDE